MLIKFPIPTWWFILVPVFAAHTHTPSQQTQCTLTHSNMHGNIFTNTYSAIHTNIHNTCTSTTKHLYSYMNTQNILTHTPASTDTNTHSLTCANTWTHSDTRNTLTYSHTSTNTLIHILTHSNTEKHSHQHTLINIASHIDAEKSFLNPGTYIFINPLAIFGGRFRLLDSLGGYLFYPGNWAERNSYHSPCE